MRAASSLTVNHPLTSTSNPWGLIIQFLLSEEYHIICEYSQFRSVILSLCCCHQVIKNATRKFFSKVEILQYSPYLQYIWCVHRKQLLWCYISQWWSKTIPSTQMCPECMQPSSKKPSPQQSPLPPIDIPKRCKTPRVGVNPTVYLSWGGKILWRQHG